uniref:TF-B3 domain-containing protein n=2 Tax=Kalanchoe fedtschenkoi TaxID=63787 RepID=A0A7N0T1U4_KALFE
MVRAESIRAGLRPGLPSLVKFMHPSSCSGGFSLSLSIKFCQHLPPEDCEVVLEDEEGQLTRTKYLAVKKALSAGWRGFSIAHQLLPGDVAVFQLVAPCRMKVHIVRASSCPAGAAEVKNTGNRQEADRPPGLAMVVYKEDKQGNGSADVTTDECFNCSPAGSETIDGIRFSESNITFKEVTSFQDFHIAVNGLIIDCEFSPDTRLKYYELCKTRSMFLHEHLLEGINCKLAAGIIIETVNIADAVQAAGPSTPEEDVAVWNRTLEAVGGLGMSVEFLRERLSCQVGHVSEADKRGDALQVKLLEVQEAARKFHAEIEALRRVDG